MINTNNISRVFLLIIAEGKDELFKPVDGIPLIERTLSIYGDFAKALFKAKIMLKGVVVTDTSNVYHIKRILKNRNLDYVFSFAEGAPSHSVSMWNGLETLDSAPIPPNDNDIVFIHNASFCSTKEELLERCLQTVMSNEICVAIMEKSQVAAPVQPETVIPSAPEAPSSPLSSSIPTMPTFSSELNFAPNSPFAKFAMETEQQEVASTTEEVKPEPKPSFSGYTNSGLTGERIVTGTSTLGTKAMDPAAAIKQKTVATGDINNYPSIVKGSESFMEMQMNNQNMYSAPEKTKEDPKYRPALSAFRPMNAAKNTLENSPFKPVQADDAPSAFRPLGQNNVFSAPAAEDTAVTNNGYSPFKPLASASNDAPMRPASTAFAPINQAPATPAKASELTSMASDTGNMLVQYPICIKYKSLTTCYASVVKNKKEFPDVYSVVNTYAKNRVKFINGDVDNIAY